MRRAPLAQLLCSLESGSRPKGGASADSGDIPSLGGENIGADGVLLLGKVRRIPRPFFAAMRSGRIEAHDILVVKDGATTGKTCLVPDAFPFQDAAANEHLFCLRVDGQTAHPQYVSHFLRSPLGQAAIQLDFRGATVGGISRGFVDKVMVPLPSLNEQLRIAAILDQAEELATKRDQTLANLDDLTQSIFVSMFGGMDLPERQLRDLVDSGDRINYGVVQPGAHVEDGVPLIRVADLSGGVVDRPNLKRIALDIEGKYTRSRIRGTEVLVSCVGTIGLVAIASAADVGANVARGVTRVPILDNDLRLYVAATLASPRIQSYFTSELRTVSQPTLNGKQIAETLIPLPPDELLRKFAKRLDAVQALRRHLHVSAGDIATLGGSLRARAFAGQL